MSRDTLPISVIVLTHNEEANIEACLSSVGKAGEIFIVDSGSTDRTLAVARQYTDNVISHPFENYSRQRNWAQANLPLKYEWVFHLDADERVTPELASQLSRFFCIDQRDSPVAGLLIRRLIEFMGRPIRHGGIYPTYHCRIFRKDLGRCEDREYDQHFVVDGPTLRLEADLIEVPASSLFSWTERHNRWAQLEARQSAALRQAAAPSALEPKLSGTPMERRRWLRERLYGRAPIFFRAFLYFFSRYILRGGFLDGTPGLIYHFLHGCWFRFYIDACLYERRLHERAEFGKQTETYRTAPQLHLERDESSKATLPRR